MRGNCYVTSEALYHLLGGKGSGWTPMRMRHAGDVHWFLKHDSGLILDPTVRQFPFLEQPLPDYSKAKGGGFLTKKPSRRAMKLMDAMLWNWETKRK